MTWLFQQKRLIQTCYSWLLLLFVISNKHGFLSESPWNLIQGSKILKYGSVHVSCLKR